ncbi:MAG: leucine-rich repeat protein, partial [Ruminococcus sp.]|nr:leucine-rich repeat protein [Ruminococcus sp.]
MFKRIIAGVLSTVICSSAITSGTVSSAALDALADSAKSSEAESRINIEALDTSDSCLNVTTDENDYTLRSPDNDTSIIESMISGSFSVDIKADEPDVQTETTAVTTIVSTTAATVPTTETTTAAPVEIIARSAPADAEVIESVNLGDTVKGDIYSNGLLLIYGYGDMKSFSKCPFANAASVTEVSFEDTDAEKDLVITSISANLFAGFTGLAELTIPDSVTSMGLCVLKGCTNLKDLTLPYAGRLKERTLEGTGSDWDLSVANLFFGASWGDWSNDNTDFTDYALEKVTITGGELVPAYAFAHMTKLKEIDLSSTKIVSINEGAFKNCTSLTTVKLPGTVTALGDYAYYNTPITALPDNGAIISAGNYAFAECKYLTDFIIPDTYQSFGRYAFANCTGITELTIPDSVTSMGLSIFNGCTNLKELTLP